MRAPNLIVNAMPDLAPSSVIEALRGIVTPHISDNLARLSGVVGLQRFNRANKLVGTAVTVKARPGDNLLIYKALMGMSPGHVLVVDGGAEVTNALIGELILLYARQRGCAGFVVDGAIRDVAAFQEFDFPCYARGNSHRGPYKNGPGAINVPVCVGGQTIHPGDIVVGDEDGVVNFPQSEAAALLDRIATTAANEAAIKAEIASGNLRQSWIDKVLSAHDL